jgi:short-subunit dehydrogenase
MSFSDPLSYPCALVTGASSGLGEEFVWQLAPRVERLVLVARRESLLLELADKVSAAFPGTGVSVFAVDLTDPAARERFLKALADDALVPDLLVNNAGMGDYGEFTTAEWPRLEAMLRVNVEALTHLTHALVPGMIRRGAGAVVNVSSLASLLPIPDFAVYAASKAYVTSFSEALRIELKEHGIPVLAVCPGPVHTGFGEVAQRGEGGRKIPGRESFYVPKEQVVEEALSALHRNKARVFPGLKTAAAALAISVAPIILLRLVMGSRPRR